MNIDVVALPRDLAAVDTGDQAVVVLDVLRATTSMAAALAVGVSEIRVFGDIESARQGALADTRGPFLCGEVNCLRPPGFDLGNSPGAFGPAHAGKVVCMSTTNGTRAIIAAQGAKVVLTGAVVNAAAVAERLDHLSMNATLLCAGTNGQMAMEDLIGAGAILDALQERRAIGLVSDVARIALRLFLGTRPTLRDAMRDAQGGRNVMAAGLGDDVDFAARLNSIAAVGVVQREPLRVVELKIAQQ